MSRSDTAFAIVTSFWAFIGVICPILLQFFMGRSPNKGIIQIMFAMTAVSCYLFWLCAYLFQLNPLIGPQLDTSLIRVMQYEWMGIDPTHEPQTLDEQDIDRGFVNSVKINNPEMINPVY